jgi:hypothetical protein
MTPARLPAFFGRVAVLLNEHERLAETLRDMRELCAAIQIGISPLPSRLDPERLLHRFKEEFLFHLMEAETCLADVAKKRPGLLPAVVDMKADHVALAGALAELDLIVADEARWGELPLSVTNLLERLRAHQEAEATLVWGLSHPEDKVA